MGEILTRGYHVMKGYFGNPAATADAIDATGWLHTGDLGSMDERGYCRIQGRQKEMIIRGGENIYPREIEQVLHAHPGVADVAVVGVPEPTGASRWRPSSGQPPANRSRRRICGLTATRALPPTRRRGTGSSWTPSPSPRLARSRNSSPGSGSPPARRQRHGSRRPGSGVTQTRRSLASVDPAGATDRPDPGAACCSAPSGPLACRTAEACACSGSCRGHVACWRLADGMVYLFGLRAMGGGLAC